MNTVFEQHVLDTAKTEPEWLSGLRQKGFSRFKELGYPTRRNEAWKAINLRDLMAVNAQPAVDNIDVPAHIIDRHIIEGIGRLVFLNGAFQPVLSSHLSDGLTTFSELIKQNDDSILSHLAQNISDESDPFSALNTALFSDGWVIRLPDNTALERPLQIVIAACGDQTAYTRGIILTGKNCKVDVLVQVVGVEKDMAYVQNVTTEVFAGEDSVVNLTTLQDETVNGFDLLNTQIHLAENANVFLTSTVFEGNICRHSVEASIEGENAHCTLNGLNILKGDSEAYHHTVIHHKSPHTTSNQLYKGILDDKTKTEFDGVIVVDKDAQKIESEQLNKNLLLSDDAKVYTRPQLQINADDVKCAHGATVGQLEEEELFYLASRGIDAELAQCLLTYGFAEDVLAKISSRAIKNHLETLMLRQLDQSQNPVLCDLSCSDTCNV